jgi:dTDP-4-amino-4,6-dideoxygalactose transaminase
MAEYLQVAEPSLGAEEEAAVKETLASGWLVQGPKVKAFEEAFAARHKVRHALAASSGTTALHLALLAVGVGPGDVVIVPSFTWVATANAVEYCGARPVFCDCRRDTYNLDPAGLERVLAALKRDGLKPKAVVAVHLFGLMAEMPALAELAEYWEFALIEDAACAAGAALAGRPAGSWGRVGCFSFHPRKTITTGEGGMCVTGEAEIAADIARRRNHGASPSAAQAAEGLPFLMADYDVLGFNYRLTDLQGALGLAQLARLDGFIEGRRRLAALYGRRLAALDWLIPPACPPGCGHSWQAYVTLVDRARQKTPRDEILRRLHEAGIGARAGTQAVHELGYYRRRYGLTPEDCPVADELYAQTLALPLHNKMGDDDVERVAEALKKIAP